MPGADKSGPTSMLVCFLLALFLQWVKTFVIGQQKTNMFEEDEELRKLQHAASMEFSSVVYLFPRKWHDLKLDVEK